MYSDDTYAESISKSLGTKNVHILSDSQRYEGDMEEMRRDAVRGKETQRSSTRYLKELRTYLRDQTHQDF